MKRIAYFLFSLMILSINCLAIPDREIVFQHIQSKTGLSQNDVLVMFQDSRGFVWIGTHDGLNRYDGYSFEVFQHDAGDDFSIVSNLIYCIDEDPNGNLWIGTTDAGICMFDRKTEKFRSIKELEQRYNLAPLKIVNDIKTEDNRVWVGSNQGLFLLSCEGDAHFPNIINRIEFYSDVVRKEEDIRINKILIDSLSRLWIGTTHGLFLRTKGSKTELVNNTDIQFRKLVKKSNNTVHDILSVGEDILIAYDDGLFLLESGSLDNNTDPFVKISENRFRFIQIDQKDQLWSGSSTGIKLYKYNKEEGKLSFIDHLKNDITNSQSLSTDIVRSMLVDRDGAVWIGTRGGGINIYSPDNNSFKHITASQHPGSIPAKKIMSLLNDLSGNIWVGSEGGGIAVLPADHNKNFNTGFVRSYQNEIDNRTIVALEEWPIGFSNTTIFYGKGGLDSYGIGKIALEDNQIEHENILPDLGHEFYSLCVVDDVELWAGSYGQGIFCIVYDEMKNDYQVIRRHIFDSGRENGLSSNIIRGMIEDRDGNIWIGTSNGLNFLSKKEKFKEKPKFENFRNAENQSHSLNNNYIIPIMQSSDGDIWVGTLGGGLNRITIDHNGWFSIKCFTTKQGLPNNSVKGIIEDLMGNIWISTNKGLSQLDPVSEHIRNYGIDDGLQDLEFSETAVIKLSDGKLIFGGVNGLNIVDPNELKQEANHVPVVFTEFSILNQPVHTGEVINGRIVLPVSITEINNINLKYIENSFSIGFSDLQYFKTSRNIIKYRLTGFDENWIVLGRYERNVKYTNVPPGKYVLQILATDIDGLWDEKAVTDMHIAIKPPFWLSPFAWVLYSIFLFVFLILFRKYTIVAVEEKNKYKMQRFQKEQLEQLTQSKLTFFTNISHEFRSPLTLIVGPLEKLINSGGKLTEKKRKHYYHLMRRNSQLMLRLIDQLMDFRKLEQGKMKMKVSEVNLLKVLEDIYDVFDELAKSRSIRFEIHYTNSKIQLWCDLDKVEKIFYNLLSNAFKNVDDYGYVFVEVEDYPEEPSLNISVKNSGMGIAKERINFVFDRFYSFDNPSKFTNVGAGIGLAFTKTLVELHHGELSVTSEENIETCFTVKFRRGNEHFTTDELVKFPVTGGDLKKIAYSHSLYFLKREENQFTDESKDKQYSLLIIEDNPEVLYFLSVSLSEKYKVYDASNGEEGLKICSKVVPNLIISDIIMPRMDGYEFCKKLKSDEKLNHIPLILLTSKSTESDQIAGLESGAEAYVSKPFSIEILEAQIDSLLEARKKTMIHFAQNMTLDDDSTEFTSLDKKFLNRLIRLIDNNIEDPDLSVRFIADELGMSQIILNRKLKAITGITTNTFIRNVRLKKAASLIEKNRYFISDIAYEVGFNDVKYFRNCFKSFYKQTPTEFAKRDKTH